MQLYLSKNSFSSELKNFNYNNGLIIISKLNILNAANKQVFKILSFIWTLYFSFTLRSGHKEEEEDEKIARIRLFSYQNNLHRERDFFSPSQTN